MNYTGMASATHLFLKREKHALPLPVSQIEAVKGYGLEGDVHAHPISPRQVLVTRQEDLDALHIPSGALFENMILSGVDEHDFVPSALLTVGDDVRIRLTFYCEPCYRVAHLVSDLAILKKKRGILGVIQTSGTMLPGDVVTCKPGVFESLSDVPYERFVAFMRKVPPGKVVTYSALLRGMGVAAAYVRAIPGYIRMAEKDGLGLPLHRIVASNGKSIADLPTDQLNLLRKEIVDENAPSLLSASVSLEKYVWQEESIWLVDEA